MERVVVVFCTFPSPERAAQVASTLVEESLAACVNVVPSIRSIYRWDGKVHDDAEVLTIIKTAASRFAALEARLADLHPYDCPEIIGVDVRHGHAPYLRWVGEMTSTDGDPV